MPADPTIRAVAVLDDQLRREMYAFIRRARRAVTRDEAAASVGISRKLAAFHLDKLVSAGLLRVGSAPPSPGPGKVGRRPKVYEPSEADIRVSIPSRQHDLLADLLLDAVLAESSAESARQAVLRLAGSRGEQIGALSRERGGRRPGRAGRLGAERALTLACGVLEEYGFEPARESPTCVRLLNCPFHPLAAKAPAMVCGINHAFLAGVVRGLEAPTIEAVLEPRAGECCVELHATD